MNKMNFYIVILLHILLTTTTYCQVKTSTSKWLLNHPSSFHKGNKLGDLTNDNNMTRFTELVNLLLSQVGSGTVGESVDALEHFFWGKRE